MKVKNRKTALLLTAVLTFGTLTPTKKADALVVGMAYGIDWLTIIGGAVIITHAPYWISYRGYNIDTALTSLVMSENSPFRSVNLEIAREDMKFYEPTAARKILADLDLIEVSEESREIQLPEPIIKFLSAEGLPDREEMESSECGLIMETARQLTEMAHAKHELEEDFRISYETAKYVIEKTPSGFQSELTSSDIEARQLAGQCKYEISI